MGILGRNTASIYLLKVNNRNTRTGGEIRLKLTIKAPELRHWRCSGVFIVIFEHIVREIKQKIKIRSKRQRKNLILRAIKRLTKIN